MSKDVGKIQARLLIDFVFLFKHQVISIPPAGWPRRYLEHLMQSIFQLQRAVKLLDTYKPFIRFLPAATYKDVVDALSYDPMKALRLSVINYDNLLNDTFLFEE